MTAARKNLIENFFINIEQCTAEDVVACIIYVVVCFILLSASIRLVKNENELKVKTRYHFIEGDIHWNNSLISSFAGFAIFGGMMASLVGLGGGVVYNPLMLEFGVNPKVASATSMYMIMLSSLSSNLQFVFLGILPIDYAIFFSIVVAI